ncbi:MAG: polysaccharide deacetylase family protein [Bacteroidales bacterium]|nr:polysaccharide deacetylase family protein [Bacteroidales bacterium]
MKTKTVLLATLTTMFINAQIQGQREDPFEWPGNAKAAVVLTYDDGLDCHLDVAVPALDKYGLKGTFYCTGNSPSLQNRTEDWRRIAKNGHELGNHTIFHPCDGERFDWVVPEYDLNTYTMEQIRNELFAANTLLKAIDGKQERTYAYTCSDFKASGKSFVDQVRTMFIAARSGGPIPESMSEVDPHFVPSWGVSDPTGEQLISYVQKASEKSTMAVFMFHSVGGGYLNVSEEAHETLLKYLNQHRDTYWSGTFMEVMRYVKKPAIPTFATTRRD